MVAGMAVCWARYLSNPHCRNMSMNSWRATATRVVEAGEVGPNYNLVVSIQGQANSTGMLTLEWWALSYLTMYWALSVAGEPN